MKILMLATVFGLGVAPTARAQHTTTPASSRVAGIAAPPAQPATPRHHSRNTGHIFYGTIPVVVFPDGRVFADLGFGYERVVTVCGASAAGLEPVVPQNGVVQPSVVQPTVVQPPVTATTPQPLNRQSLASSGVVDAGTCWWSDGYGRVFVRR